MTAAVLFDFDGTLVHHPRHPIDFDGMRRGIRELIRDGRAGIEVEGLPHDVLGLVREGALRVESLDGPVGRRAFEAACARLILEEELRAAEGAEAAPGARELLAALDARGIAIAICTRNARAIVERLTTKLGIAYRVLVAREDTARPKPAPMHLRRALVQLGCSPRAAVFVGDHAMDALGARRAGLRSFGVPGTYPPSPAAIERAFLAHRPDVMLGSLLDLLPHL